MKYRYVTKIYSIEEVECKTNEEFVKWVTENVGKLASTYFISEDNAFITLSLDMSELLPAVPMRYSITLMGESFMHLIVPSSVWATAIARNLYSSEARIVMGWR